MKMIALTRFELEIAQAAAERFPPGNGRAWAVLDGGRAVYGAEELLALDPLETALVAPETAVAMVRGADGPCCLQTALDDVLEALDMDCEEYVCYLNTRPAEVAELFAWARSKLVTPSMTKGA